jgi:hypothetical protein
MTGLAEPRLLDDVALKGPRTYLQSADLWTAAERRLAAGAGPGARMAITFRKLTDRRVAIVPLASSDRARRAADLRVTDGATTSDYALEETDVAVTERIECPEARLLPTIALGDMTAAVVVPDFATALECLVAATKKLHLAAVQPDVKWVVGRLDLPLPFPADPGAQITTTIAHRLPRQSTVSTIAVDGRDVGTVMFNILR